MESKIVSVKAREILDSRGNPTLEVEVSASGGIGRASVPSGASTGTHEAIELRDRDKARFHGKGVLKAASNVNDVIAPAIVGRDCHSQEEIDALMVEIDGTSDRGRLGANAILGVSMAAARAAAASDGVSLFAEIRTSDRYILPVPMMNVINGGEHADNGLAIQEFMIEPVGGKSCSEAIRMGAEVYQSLKEVLKSDYGGGATNVGDEGGFAPQMTKTAEALDALVKAVRSAGYSEYDVRLGLDSAASTFFDKGSGKYQVDGRALKAEELEDYYADLQDRYGILTFEDPFSEEEFAAFGALTRRLGASSKIIGDDLYVTNVRRMAMGVESNATNGVLIKLNQIGTLTETLEAIEMARNAGWSVAVSHRSGETADPFISHLATAVAAEFIKAGAPARGERAEKYNELLRIEEILGGTAGYSGTRFVK